MSGGALMKVAVIVVNWNGRDDTLECLSSVGKVAGTGLSVIVVDNGSTDGSAQAIRERFPAVTLIETGRNLRFAGGNNTGIRLALEQGADAVILLNNDTVVQPDLADVLTTRLRSDPGIGMVSPKICYYQRPQIIWFAGARIRFWRGTMEHIGIRETDRGQFNVTRESDYATGCCVMVSRTVLEAVGLLDESYFMYAEDTDWSIRARRSGYRVVYEPGTTVLHKISASAGGNLSCFKLKHKFLSQIRFFSRYASWYHWLVIPWMSILVNVTLLVRQLHLRKR